MHLQAADSSRLILVRLDPGEDVLVSLRSAASDLDIKNAVIVSGVGSLDRYRAHVVETTNMPPGNVFFSGEGPFDIVAITGLIVNGEVHAHITFSNPDRTLGGHLEEGCRVLTFVVVAVIEAFNTDLEGWDKRGPLRGQ